MTRALSMKDYYIYTQTTVVIACMLCRPGAATA